MSEFWLWYAKPILAWTAFVMAIVNTTRYVTDYARHIPDLPTIIGLLGTGLFWAVWYGWKTNGPK